MHHTIGNGIARSPAWALPPPRDLPVMAPMVNQGELAFRVFCREKGGLRICYGGEIPCFSPW